MERDWRVDTLRGYFLVAMTLGHFPNPLARYTEYTFGYASAPDGFVFLSGLVSAWVYLRVWQRRGHRAMVSKSLHRAGTIYLTHIALLLLSLAVAFVPGMGAHPVHSFRSFISGALLWSSAGFDRILPMYCVFMALNPLVLNQFPKGRAWLVGIISAVLWTSAQFGLGDQPLGAYSFNPLAWQAYFVAGQYIGFRTLRSEGAVVGKSRILLAACFVIALPLMLDRHLLWLRGSDPLLGFSGHPDHNPIRFLDTACLAYIIFWIPRAADLVAAKLRFFQFLNLLGRHSLQVFAFSMIFTRFEAHTIKMLSPEIQLALTLATVLSLAVPAWLHQYFRQRRSDPHRNIFRGPAQPPYAPTATALR